MPKTKQPASQKVKLDCAVRTQEEVAAIMTARGFPMTRANIWEIERRALRKLRVSLADLYREMNE